MPYTLLDIKGDKAQEYLAIDNIAKRNFTENERMQTDRVHVVASSFTDPGDDWNRIEIYSKDGTLIRSVHIDGY